MTVNEIAPYVLGLVGGAVAITLLWYIFVKAPRARLDEFAAWAKKRGFVFRPPIFLGSHSQGYETSGLEGAVQGVPFVLRSSRLVNSRKAGINGSTEVLLRAFAPSAASFNITFEAGRVQGAIPTGDPVFDANLSTRSDHPHAALAWLNPQLRAAIYGVVVRGATLVCSYAGGEMKLRLADPIHEEAQLDRVLALTVAAAYARLG